MGEIAELCDLSGRRGIKRAGIGSDRGGLTPARKTERAMPHVDGCQRKKSGHFPIKKSARIFIYGRSDWIRTSGLLVPNQALYQTEPHPATCFSCTRTVYHMKIYLSRDCRQFLHHFSFHRCIPSADVFVSALFRDAGRHMVDDLCDFSSV